MKVLNKLAAIALVVGTSQVFASDSLSANWQPPEPDSLQISAMEPMSLDELSAVEGGTWIAKLTPNQVIMTLTGFTASMIAGPLSQLSIRVGTVADIASVVDQMVCQSGVGMVGTMLSQGQISAGRIDDRQLGAADVGLSLAFGTGLTFAQRGCSRAVEAISQQISKSNEKGREIAKKKDQKYEAVGQLGRRMLTDKLNEQDRWAHWALSTAQTSRDKVERAKHLLDLHIEARQNCWGITYPVCAYTMNNRVAMARWALSVAVLDFVADLEATGKPLIERAKLLNMPLPNPNSLQMPTYDIN